MKDLTVLRLFVSRTTDWIEYRYVVTYKACNYFVNYVCRADSSPAFVEVRKLVQRQDYTHVQQISDWEKVKKHIGTIWRGVSFLDRNKHRKYAFSQAAKTSEL